MQSYEQAVSHQAYGVRPHLDPLPLDDLREQLARLTWTIHKYCRVLACPFARTESLVGRPYAWLRSTNVRRNHHGDS